MFKKQTNLFTADCIVILFRDDAVYPIFKNGQTSLFEHTRHQTLKTTLKNDEISKLKKIKIFLREPRERFISGVHTVIEQEKINDVNGFLKKVENFRIYNRHFIPQYYWLLHLYKYFKGDVELLSVKKLYELIPNRAGPAIKKITKQRRDQILTIDHKKYVDVDYKLIKKYIEKTVKLEKIIKEFKNAVS